jgi:hypothetical protein
MNKAREITVHYNKEFKIASGKDMQHWKDSWGIYVQRIKGKTFVTFKGVNGHVHFNDSHSISINEFYGKKETLLDMIKMAERYGW